MPQDAISILKQDHVKVKGLLKELSSTSTKAVKKRSQLFDEIEKELKVHTRLEEELFYPAFKVAGGAEHDRMNYEALEEHRAVEKLVLPDLKNTDAGTEQFSGRVKVLKELVEHHADEEEEEMFPKARKSLTKEELDDLGEQIAARKAELQKE